LQTSGAGNNARLIGSPRINWVDDLSSGFVFDGILSDLSVFTRNLTANEISGIRDFGLVGNEPGLQASYRLNEASGLSVVDSTGKNANGTLGLNSVSTTMPSRTTLRSESFNQSAQSHIDLNGDRIDDLVFNAAYASDPSNIADTGALYIGYGSPSRIALPPAYDHEDKWLTRDAGGGRKQSGNSRFGVLPAG